MMRSEGKTREWAARRREIFTRAADDVVEGVGIRSEESAETVEPVLGQLLDIALAIWCAKV